MVVDILIHCDIKIMQNFKLKHQNLKDNKISIFHLTSLGNFQINRIQNNDISVVVDILIDCDIKIMQNFKLKHQNLKDNEISIFHLILHFDCLGDLQRQTNKIA